MRDKLLTTVQIRRNAKLAVRQPTILTKTLARSLAYLESHGLASFHGSQFLIAKTHRLVNGVMTRFSDQSPTYGVR